MWATSISRELAVQMDDAGVTEAYVEVGDKEVKILSNGMVDISKFVNFDAKAECGVNERVRFKRLEARFSTPAPTTTNCKEQIDCPHRRSDSEAYYY